MAKLLIVFLFTLLTGCASIGFDGVEVNPDDTWITIALPVVILFGLYFAKKEIDLWYVKKELRIRKKAEVEDDNKDT